MGLLVVTDPQDQQRLIAERQRSGADKFDEVWEGTYVMAPLANDEHQAIQLRLGAVFQTVVGWSGAGLVRAGVNVSDRDVDWTNNFRCPDVAVFMEGTTARNHDTHWLGGPDFAVEILSPGDRTPEKLPFYAKVKVRELLVVDREPWSVELYRLQDGELAPVGSIKPGDATSLTSNVLPLSFRLLAGTPRPSIEVAQRDSSQKWLV